MVLERKALDLMVFNGSQPMQWPNPLSLMVLMVGKQSLVSME